MKAKLKELGEKATLEVDCGWYEEEDDRKVTATDTTLKIKASFSHMSGNGGTIRESYTFTVENDKLLDDNGDDSCSLDAPELQEFVNEHCFFDGNC